MSIKEKIENNVWTVLFLTAISTATITWSISEKLNVKPRDFRISELKDNLQACTAENTELTSELKTSIAEDRKPEETKKELISSDTVNQAFEELQNLQKLFTALRNPTLTKLQRKRLQGEFEGQKVLWDVYVISVSEPSFSGNIDLILTHDLDTNSLKSLQIATASFDKNQEDVLSLLNVGQKIKISGTLDNLMIFPKLGECKIVASL
jgi:hypothetical protein